MKCALDGNNGVVLSPLFSGPEIGRIGAQPFLGQRCGAVISSEEAYFSHALWYVLTLHLTVYEAHHMTDGTFCLQLVPGV